MGIVPQLLANSIISGATYTLCVLGFNLIYGATKFVNMAHGTVAVVGGYAAFFIVRTLGFGMWWGIAAGIIAAGVVGFGANFLVYAPLRKRKASPLVLFIASLGIFTVLESALSILFGPQLELLPVSGAAAKSYIIYGAAVTGAQILIIVSAALAVVGLAALLRYSMFGKVVKAISDDEEVAKMLGINTSRIIGLVFFISSALAGLLGVLSGFDLGMQPTFGLTLILVSAAASIVGGIGNLYGGVIGAFLLGFAENFGIWFIPGQWKGAISLGILLIFLIAMPRGIMKK